MTIEIQLSRGQKTIVDDCDADLNQFKWHASHCKGYAGGGKFIARRSIYSRTEKDTIERLHRVVLSRMLGRPLLRTEFADHINGDTLDNRRENLRLATHEQNMRNKKHYSNSKSGLKGATQDKRTGKWVAYIGHEGRVKNLGAYDTPEEAHAAYCGAARVLHGEFANLD